MARETGRHYDNSRVLDTSFHVFLILCVIDSDLKLTIASAEHKDSGDEWNGRKATSRCNRP